MAEGQVTPSAGNLNFDDDTLKAIAKVYLEEGNKEHRRKEFGNAIYFYTEGIQVNCKDEVLDAKLYSNRATANLHLGNYQKTINDAAAAVDLEPTFIKAIERGASACVKLERYKEAMTWCVKGFAIDKKNKTLLDLWARCVGATNTSTSEETKRKGVDSTPVTHTLKSQIHSEDYLPNNDKGAGGNVKEVGSKATDEGSLGRFKAGIDYRERCLQVAKELGFKAGEGEVYSDLADAYQSLGDVKTVIDYHELRLKVTSEIGDKAEKGKSYSDLGNTYQSQSDLKTTVDYYERCIEIAKEMGMKSGEGWAYEKLGIAYHSRGEFKTAIFYHKCYLKIAKEVGFKEGEKIAYCYLGLAFQSLGDIKTAIEYHERCLKVVKEVGEKADESKPYCNLGNAYWQLGDFKAAIDYYKRCLEINNGKRDKVGEGIVYCNLGTTYQSLGDYKTAIYYHERGLKIASEVGDHAMEGKTYCNLGNTYLNLGDVKTAIDYNQLGLKIATEMGNRAEEGAACGNLGNAYRGLGNFKTAINYYERTLNIAKESGDKVGEACTYGNLGNVYNSLCDFKNAIEYYERDLEITKEVGDKASEGRAYGHLGSAYHNLGDFKTARDYNERWLKIAKEVGDKEGEAGAYSLIGNDYNSLGDLKTAIDYHEGSLKIAKDVGLKKVVGVAYGNLGNIHRRLGDFKTAIVYLERCLKICKEVGNKEGIGSSYGNLSDAYYSLGDFETSIDYSERHLKIAKEVGDKRGVANSFYRLGKNFESQGSSLKALDCYHSSVKMFNKIRNDLQGKDEWKINFRDEYEYACSSLLHLSLKHGKVVQALFAAEQGRAQALNDLMELNYGLETLSQAPEDSSYDSFCLNFLPSTAIFMATDDRDIVFWVVQNGSDVELRRKKLSDGNSLNLNNFFKSLLEAASEEIGVRAGVECEDRSLDNVINEKLANERSPQTQPNPSYHLKTNALRQLYDIIIGPLGDLVRGSEIILVPEGPLFLAPYAAFMDLDSRYLCEFCRIRVIPSLTSLKLITDCPDGYHSKTGVLLVGDPWVQEVVYQGNTLEQLPCAREEVQMIGRILNSEPLIGREATKHEVLRRLSSIALVHIAAHGRMETGEIALAPSTTRTSQIPVEEDFLLTMKDVMSVKIRARLVVLSCCHSGRGTIRAEGVVGIARAFLGAGARSVLVSLWAIDDEATLEFMKYFYSHLAKGISASKSLNQAMKCMRESDEFSEVKYWAPFVLIGDDVTLEFGGSE